MHVEDSIQNGDSVVFTFNKENDRYQRIYDGVDENKARHVLFTSAGMDVLTAEVVHTGDQGAPNNFVQAEIGVGKWIETIESTGVPIPMRPGGMSRTIMSPQQLHRKRVT